MGSRIRCFMLDALDPPAQRLWLRRYGSGHGGVSACPKMSGEFSYHNAMVLIADQAPAHYEERGAEFKHRVIVTDQSEPAHDDPRWPLACSCGYVFVDRDEWQLFARALYRRRDTGELMTLNAVPAGALWNAWWLADCKGYRGLDGMSLMCQTPGGEWTIDGRASNCTMPEDTDHKCWVRHGEPPDITVDKDGKTCGAGGGSIVAGGYHGFLRNGYLEEC